MKETLFRLANKLYVHCYPAYDQMYSVWKVLSERHERALVRNFIQPNMIVVDIGANIGIYTRFFADLTGESGHVHAFEPAPLNFRRLHDNVGARNNVTANQSAVGAGTGTIKLYVSDELNVDHRTFDSADGRYSIDVPVVSLDEYFVSGQSVDFIKIDVQGYEFSVLQGARRVLEENHEIKILMEFWPYGLIKAGVAPNALIDLILSLGFEIRMTKDLSEGTFDATKLETNRIDHYCNLFIARA